MAIPQLTLSLIAGMTPEEHEISIVEEVHNETIDFDLDVEKYKKKKEKLGDLYPYERDE